jgi:hypothetical protein
VFKELWPLHPQMKKGTAATTFLSSGFLLSLWDPYPRGWYHTKQPLYKGTATRITPFGVTVDATHRSEGKLSFSSPVASGLLRRPQGVQP